MSVVTMVVFLFRYVCMFIVRLVCGTSVCVVLGIKPWKPLLGGCEIHSVPYMYGPLLG